MSGSKNIAVIPIGAAKSFRALSHGEILQGEFSGQPLVSVYDPKSARGAACIFDGTSIDHDFAIWYEALRRDFGAEHLLRLQIKFIVGHENETAVKALCIKHSIVPQAVAGVDGKARLDVFFFTDSGRLRIAPSASSFRETSKEVNALKAKKKARVLIVDDSGTMRKLLRKIIEGSADLEVVGEAERPSQVEELIAKTQPDVMTLDINMPEMSGVQLLRKILSYRFLPTVMISALNINDGEEVLTALEVGAVDYIHKPEASELASMTPFIQEKILNAARVRGAKMNSKLGNEPRKAHAPAPRATSEFARGNLIAIGASTGGTEAIKQIFVQFPKETPPILVVQHIPPYFSTAFAKRLNELCKFEVREAQDGDEIRPGRALIAPGGRHLEVRQQGNKIVASVTDSAPVNRFKPSVDVLFHSVAKVMRSHATGILLTGMGSDGAKGLLDMKQVGAFTIAQDEETSVVYGMPRAAAEMGAAMAIEPIDQIASTLMAMKKAA